MARSLALRALAGAGAFAASMVLGTGWAGAAPAEAASAVSARTSGTFSLPVQTPGDSWCSFLQRLYGWDVCGGDGDGGGGGGGPGNGNGNGPGNGNGNGPGGPPTTAAPPVTDPSPTMPPVTASPGVPGEVPTATLPPATPVPTAPPAPPLPTAPPPGPVPAAEQAPQTTAARTAPPRTSPTTAAAATAPPTAATTAGTVPTTLPERVGGLLQAEVQVQPAADVARDVLPEPRRTDRSLIRSVIDTTSGPIGRRVVALAGVLLAVVIGIVAATIDDRTQLVRKIQEHRHVDEH